MSFADLARYGVRESLLWVPSRWGVQHSPTLNPCPCPIGQTPLSLFGFTFSKWRGPWTSSLDPDAKELQRWYRKMTGAARGDCLQVPREEQQQFSLGLSLWSSSPQDACGWGRAAHQPRQDVNESKARGNVIKSLGALGSIPGLNQVWLHNRPIWHNWKWKLAVSWLVWNLWQLAWETEGPGIIESESGQVQERQGLPPTAWQAGMTAAGGILLSSAPRQHLPSWPPGAQPLKPSKVWLLISTRKKSGLGTRRKHASSIFILLNFSFCIGV